MSSECLSRGKEGRCIRSDGGEMTVSEPWYNLSTTRMKSLLCANERRSALTDTESAATSPADVHDTLSISVERQTHQIEPTLPPAGTSAHSRSQQHHLHIQTLLSSGYVNAHDKSETQNVSSMYVHHRFDR